MTLRSMTAEGRGVDDAITPTSGDPEKRVWPSCLGGGKPGDIGVVRDVGDWQCGGRATDEPVLAAPIAAVGKPAGRQMPGMRRACALLMMSSFSSTSALSRAASIASRSAANMAVAALPLTTALRFLLFVDSASNLAISSGVHSDRGFLGALAAFFFTFPSGSTA